MSVQTQFGDPRTVEITEAEANPRDKCCFCGRHEVNAVEWGSLLKLGNIVTHHFCLLFSANVEQKGTDHQGIQAFLPADILRELKRGKRLRCKFCKKVNATIGCGVAACRFSYHYPCGYEKGCLFQFYGQFQSYCSNPKHRPSQEIPPGTDSMCSICFVETDPEEAVWPPCCGKQLFHRTCIMHAAKAAGYFFKCPLCNSKEAKFTQAMKANGVYVPEQDAAWETEPNAFQELMQHYSQCDAKPCVCPDGRGFEARESKDWCLIRCEGCASSATHMKCSGLKTYTWKCEGCDAVLQTPGMNSTSGNPADSASDDESDDEGNSATSDSSDESSNEEEVIAKLPNITEMIKCNNKDDIDASIEEVVNNYKLMDSKSQEREETEQMCNNNSTGDPEPVVEAQVEKIKRTSRPFVAENVNFNSFKEFVAKRKPVGFRNSNGQSNQDTNVNRYPLRRRIRNPSVHSLTNYETRLEQLRQYSIQGHDKEQNEEEKIAERKRFETLQAFMTSKSLERKALRSMNRKTRDVNPLEIMQTLNLLESRTTEIRKLPPIPRYSQRSGNCPNNEPSTRESAVDIGREMATNARHYHQRLMDKYVIRHPNTRNNHPAEYNHSHAPNPNLTLNSFVHLEHNSCSIKTASLEPSQSTVSSIQDRLLKIAGNYHTSPNPSSTSNNVENNNSDSTASSNHINQADPIKFKCINLDTDSDDEVTEIIPTPVADPDIVIDKVIPAPRVKANIPRSAALKALQGVSLRMQRRSTFPQSYASSLLLKPTGNRRSSNPEVITLDDEELHGSTGRVNMESVWNEVDSYHGRNNISFQNLPHDYWLNSNALNFINKEYSNALNLNGERSHSVGSTLLPSTSSSFIDTTRQQNSGQHYYTGATTKCQEDELPTEIGAPQVKFEYRDASPKRPRRSP